MVLLVEGLETDVQSSISLLVDKQSSRYAIVVGVLAALVALVLKYAVTVNVVSSGTIVKGICISIWSIIPSPATSKVTLLPHAICPFPARKLPQRRTCLFLLRAHRP